MEKSIVCDTGTLLSFFWFGIHVEGFLKKFKSEFRVVITSGVHDELREFGKYGDTLGIIAKKILKENFEIVRVEDNKIISIKKELGVSGKQRITDNDLKCFTLAREKKTVFFTDDFSVLIHLSSFFPNEKIFHGIALAAKILSELIGKEESYNLIFNKFIPKRWEKITEKRLVDLEKIVSEVLGN